jgi:hypothetical protein
MTTPMQRTLAEIKQQDCKYWIVENWNQWAKKRVDLFGIIDLLVLDNGVVGLQVCGTDWSAHLVKIMETEKENTIAWLQQPGTRLEVWGWRKLKKKRGGKAMYWAPRIADVIINGNELEWRERD